MTLVTAPARYEGFGMVPLEAMACGKPVIASRTGAYGQMIDPGVNGWLVNTDDLEGFTEVLSTALSDESLLSEMGISGMNKVKQEFSAEVEAEKIVSVYKDMWAMAEE
jgi:mannosyltransferase